MKKTLPNFDFSRQEEPAQPIYNDFNLDKQDSLKYFFNERQMEIEPEDHMSCFMGRSPAASEIIPVKEEVPDVSEYISFVPSEKQKIQDESFSCEVEAVRILQEKCRLVEQIIFATSTESIFEYGIGFDSEEEPQQAALNQHISISGSQKISQIGQSIDSQFSMVKVEEDPLFAITRPKICQQGFQTPKRFSTLISCWEESSNNSVDMQKVIQMVVDLNQKKLTDKVKEKFLTLFEKLESMKAGILLKKSQILPDQHKCKVCGQEFTSGRQLGGHISRRHSTFSFEYQMKKISQSAKNIERNRKSFFNNQKKKKKSLYK